MKHLKHLKINESSKGFDNIKVGDWVFINDKFPGKIVTHNNHMGEVIKIDRVRLSDDHNSVFVRFFYDGESVDLFFSNERTIKMYASSKEELIAKIEGDKFNL